MEIIGLDLHKRESQLCRRSPEGCIRDERIPTTRAPFTAALGGQAPARILLEASTESEWVAAHLESAEHVQGMKAVTIVRGRRPPAPRLAEPNVFQRLPRPA